MSEEKLKSLMARIFMPKIEAKDIEALKGNEPFLLKASIPRGAQFISVNAVPSIIDMMGFSGGGGAPAFAYLIDPDEEETYDALLMTALPEARFHRLEPLKVDIKPLGVVQSMGMLLMCFEWSGEDIDTVTEGFKAHGAHIFETHPYQVPEMLKLMSMQTLVKAKADAAAQPKST